MPRIQHISLEVRSDLIAEETAFWRTIGFVRVGKPAGVGESSIWVQAGDQQVHLLPKADPVQPGTGHVALVLDDFERTIGTLRADGFEIVPGEQYWDSPRVKITAPSGYPVELMESPPALP